MITKRILGVLSVAVAGCFTSGCMVDISPTLPPLTVDYNFPAVGGLPIVGDLFLPNINTCETLSEEALLATVENSGAATFFLQLLFDLVEIKNVSVLEGVMEATAPDGANFEGLSQVTFLENDRVILTATANNGINGKRVELTTDDPINLIEVINACPERASNIRVKVEGLIPLNAPTQWKTSVTVRVVAGLSLF